MWISEKSYKDCPITLWRQLGDMVFVLKFSSTCLHTRGWSLLLPQFQEEARNLIYTWVTGVPLTADLIMRDIPHTEVTKYRKTLL